MCVVLGEGGGGKEEMGRMDWCRENDRIPEKVLDLFCVGTDFQLGERKKKKNKKTKKQKKTIFVSTHNDTGSLNGFYKVQDLTLVNFCWAKLILI